MSNKAIVLDANILVRAVLGKRVRELILENLASVKFFRQRSRMPTRESIYRHCWKSGVWMAPWQ